MSDLQGHIDKLTKLSWGQFKAHPSILQSMKPVRDDIEVVCKLMQHHVDYLGMKVQSEKASSTNEKNSDSVTAAFKNSLKTVSLADDEFWAEIDHTKRGRKKKRGKQSPFSTCVAEAVKKVFRDLCARPDYKPLFLTDEEMCRQVCRLLRGQYP